MNRGVSFLFLKRVGWVPRRFGHKSVHRINPDDDNDGGGDDDDDDDLMGYTEGNNFLYKVAFFHRYGWSSSCI